MHLEFLRHPLIRLSVMGLLFSLGMIGSGGVAQQLPDVGLTKDEAAEAEPSAVPEEFASPRATINTFLLYINQVVEDPKNVDAVEQVFRTLDVPRAVGGERGNMALKLLGFFNALGKIDAERMAPGTEEIEAERLSRFEFFPTNPYPAASALIQRALADTGSVAPPGAVVLVRSESGEWKFSADTMDDIGKLWSWIEVRGVRHGRDIRELSLTERIRDRLVPAALKGEFILGLEAWQWVGLVLVLFAAVVGGRVSRILLAPAVRWVTVRAIGETDDGNENAMLRPVGLLISTLIVWALLRPLGLVGAPLIMVIVAVKLAAAYGAGWTAWALADLIAAASLYKAESRELAIDNMIIPLLRRTAKLLIVALALLYTAGTLDINLIPLLGSLGLVGLAISFAAQDIVKNIFGGVTIFLDRPFKTGDRVKYGGYDGLVQQIGFRSTKVKLFTGHLVTIPNGMLTSEAVENVSSRTTIMRSFSVNIPYDTPSAKVAQAVEIVEAILAEDGIRESIHPIIDGAEWAPMVKFDSFNADSFNILVVYWHEPPSWSVQMQHAQRLNLRIVEEFEQAGIEFALPAQALRISGESPRSRSLRMLGADLERSGESEQG